MSSSFRIGSGFDVHRFADEESPGASITLAGIRIPHDRNLLAHSDGDVLVHALCDAFLGALALGDIGQHFPDTDQNFAGIDSMLLLKHVMGLVTAAGWRLGNADMTVIAQSPKIAPHANSMRSRLAECLETDVGNISIKATTTEKLGFTGREEGIACQAQVLLTDSSIGQ